MSKKNLFYIICAMSIAFLGFISIQFYWTHQVFSLREEIFNNTVSQAMNEVVFQTNRRDLTHRVLRYRQHTELIRRIDTLNQWMAVIRRSHPDIDFDEHAFSRSSHNNFILNEDILFPDTLSGTMSPHPSAAVTRRLKNTYRAWERERSMLFLNSRLFEELIREAMQYTAEPQLLLRVNPYHLDTLIRQELDERGLKIDVEWGIFSTEQSKLVVRRSRDYGVHLLQSPYYYRLFPNAPTPDAYYLLVDFPHRKVFIASQMWYLHLATLLLLGLQLFAFAYTLRAVIRQHRFATAKADFINHITHEIKTPVSTISLVCESFRDPDIHYSETDIHNILNIVQHESGRLQQLSRQMIEISTLEKGFFQLERQECDLHELIRQAINHSGFQIMLNRGQILTDLQATHTMIFGDKERLVSVFSNLIENANKYCERAPSIQIGSRDTAGGIEITVADNGIGIPKKQWYKIFEKLYRVPAGNAQKNYGFGLGLSFVKSITEQHKGKIWVESELKKGSTFHLMFPATVKADSDRER